MHDLALYLHIPFCIHKCSYCNFASGEFSTLSQESYVDALIAEVLNSQEIKTNKVKSIFIGGGTPSFLSKELLKKLFKSLEGFLEHVDEFTIENNPNSLDEDKLKLYQQSGVNRLSLGVQSFNEKELKFLERVHDVSTAHQALEIAEKYFPRRWNADLIYALPEQKIASFENSLKELSQHNPQHVSCYELTYENETPLGQDLKKGKIKALADDNILSFQNSAQSTFKSWGLERYEVSNYAKKGFECQHNMNIWQGMNFIGCGNGAHGRYKWHIRRNVSSPSDYIQRQKEGKTLLLENSLDSRFIDKLSTLLLLGLRCKEGLRTHKLQEISKGLKPRDIWPKLPEHLEKRLDFSEKSLCCKPEAWDVIDQIIVELIDCAEGFSPF
jgi:oxygen-independent coproporphyrinogen-3 oxidase